VCEAFPDGTAECITLEESEARKTLEAETGESQAPTTGEEGDEVQAVASDTETTQRIEEAQQEVQSLQAPSADTPPGCGNGIEDDGEECDDGNLDNKDGCDQDCRVECGFTCVGGGCGPICGDGIKAGTEKCDGVEGCSDNCTPLPDFECETDENKCSHVCGNGIQDEGEECDGGHNILGHFPSPWCTKECTRAPHWKCFADNNKPCVKDCPNPSLAKSFGREYWVI